ncbi:MAG: TVP38/TMEM64 family protein [Bdellovibrionales bacterium]|nr:TVP38/TMEM64 family protein [Bdellovibrionales bacterium]
MKKKQLKFILLIAILTAISAFFIFDLGQYLDFSYLKQQKDTLHEYYQNHKFAALFAYLIIYIIVTALSLPGATVLTLMGGAIFGLLTGVIIVSFASTIGATLAFLSARFILRESIEKKFGDKLVTINKGIANEGSFYLLTLRLIPLFPFFVINLVMGLTQIKTWRFFLVSQIGMLPGTAVYVNAGTQLAQINSLKGILSPQLLLSFALLGIFPLIAKKIIDFVRNKKNAQV